MTWCWKTANQRANTVAYSKVCLGAEVFLIKDHILWPKLGYGLELKNR